MNRTRIVLSLTALTLASFVKTAAAEDSGAKTAEPPAYTLRLQEENSIARDVHASFDSLAFVRIGKREIENGLIVDSHVSSRYTNVFAGPGLIVGPHFMIGYGIGAEQAGKSSFDPMMGAVMTLDIEPVRAYGYAGMTRWDAPSVRYDLEATIWPARWIGLGPTVRDDLGVGGRIEIDGFEQKTFFLYYALLNQWSTGEVTSLIGFRLTP